jgi:hypothetical protein
MQIIIENIIIKARKKFKNLFIQSATCNVQTQGLKGENTTHKHCKEVQVLMNLIT